MARIFLLLLAFPLLIPTTTFAQSEKCYDVDELIDDGEYEAALIQINACILQYPDTPLYYSCRGEAYLHTGNAELALLDYNHAIALAGSVPDYYYDRGLAYLFLRRFEESIPDFTKALGIDRTHRHQVKENHGPKAEK
ncbi:MAG: hypothetical protein L0154_11725 [Chloroflexi bacterium]|nr:hypothetical protein [Chloroflexota bacterium]